MAVAIYAVPQFARIVRAAAQPIVGARVRDRGPGVGASVPRVLRRHVLPGCAPPMLAHATVMLGSAILLASGLSFLGLGVQPPEAEWGAMLSRGRELVRTAPLGAVAPGVAITATVLSFSLLGDGLRDARPPPPPGQLIARWTIALKRWRSESGLAGRALRHQHDDRLLDRIDPEDRAGRAVPPVLAAAGARAAAARAAR